MVNIKKKSLSRVKDKLFALNRQVFLSRFQFDVNNLVSQMDNLLKDFSKTLSVACSLSINLYPLSSSFIVANPL